MWFLAATIVLFAPAVSTAEIMSTRLNDCPASPNCVSSDATDSSHQIAPFVLKQPGTDAWKIITEVVQTMSRTNITVNTGTYLHVECRSAIFRFVDDLQLEWRADQGIVAVRSASRIGYTDFGVNRRRVERLRSVLETRGVIQKP